MKAELTGRRLGVYQLQERVGAGGMGEVYRARDTQLQRDVAVKILPEATIQTVPTSALRVDGAGPRPQALFRPCPGSGPQSQPMTAQFWSTPFDTLDGRRFIVSCAMRPSREYVVLMNWPLAQKR